MSGGPERCDATTTGVFGARLGCDQIKGHVGLHVDGHTYWGSEFPSSGGPEVRQQLAERAEERGEGICRTCLAPIWNEGGTVGYSKRAEGWSDRIERGGDSLVCFKAREYRHVPLTGREACIYDHAYARGRAEALQAAGRQVSR